MINKLRPTIFIGLLCFVLPSFSQEDSSGLDTATFAEIMAYYEEAEEMNASLDYQKGTIVLGDELATLNLNEGFRYLNDAETQKILVEAWGNPPQETLGMIFPDSVNPYLPEGWGVVLSYVEDGHIDDDDAADIDYEDLLEELKEEAVESSKERRELGYGGYSLVGWAESPYYDQESKKLYWAKELAFDESDINTLNYDIRVLGRKGYLRLNAIASVDQLEMVKPSMQDLLGKVEFNQGNTYFDFNPDVDEVAAYGIGALVAGKLAAKAGLIKVIGIFFAKFWKIILIAGGALIAFIKKIWTGKEQREIG